MQLNYECLLYQCLKCICFSYESGINVFRTIINERKINTLLIWRTRKGIILCGFAFFFLKPTFILLIFSKLRIFRRLFASLIFRQKRIKSLKHEWNERFRRVLSRFKRLFSFKRIFVRINTWKSKFKPENTLKRFIFRLYRGVHYHPLQINAAPPNADFPILIFLKFWFPIY